MYICISKITWNFQLRNQPNRWEWGEKVDVIILKQLFKLRRFGAANPFITTTYISVFTQQFIASWWKSKDVLSCFIISRSWPRFDFKKWGKCLLREDSSCSVSFLLFLLIKQQCICLVCSYILPLESFF